MDQKASATNAASDQQGGKSSRRRATSKKETEQAGVARQDTGTPAAAPDPEKTEPDSSLLSRIRERAYRLFESCGCQHGHDLEHWLEAEREVTDSPKSGSDRHEKGKGSSRYSAGG